MERLNAEPANDDDDDIDDLIDPEVMDEAPEEFEGAETDDAVGVEAVDDGESAPKEVVPVDAETWQRYRRIVEALLFASAEPMTERMLANRLPEDADVKGLLKELRETYAERGVHLVRAGASWAFRTAPDLSEFLNKEIEVARKLSRAAIETLSIIAYHQPVTRAEIEEIRGVGISKGTVDVLLENEWIRPRGRRQTPGRPLQWGTTDAFLDHFGLETLRDLPGTEELKAAGLLDASPAINAYRSTAGEGPSNEDENTGDEDDPLPQDALGDGAEEPDEPLDPDDGTL
tara:strand:- start:29265 stop:30128 length:864 start_codon:yes stop_codon:yes gene_type:complete